MGAARWVRRSSGVLVGLSPAALVYLLSRSDFGNCAQAWYLTAAFLGVVPWSIVFLGSLSTLFETDAPESRDFAVGGLVGALVLAAVFVTGFATDSVPLGIRTTAHCHSGATLD
ncbi:hypothetical protein [Catellatospora vulcania]|uniref:hypothetical protein n=1 Tax=Catellatospora vulcania TaxID=1460450 RepID=UPI0012D4BF28|nr:hypothetical protein [Catellatospora vulcania]